MRPTQQLQRKSVNFLFIFVLWLLHIICFQSLASAASILLKGAERMRRSHAETNAKQSHTDFHYELLKLRQNWRLKKVGNVILGDLSFKSCELFLYIVDQ